MSSIQDTLTRDFTPNEQAMIDFSTNKYPWLKYAGIGLGLLLTVYGITGNHTLTTILGVVLLAGAVLTSMKKTWNFPS